MGSFEGGFLGSLFEGGDVCQVLQSLGSMLKPVREVVCNETSNKE